jgi:fatty acid CoA ligase FadD21
MQAGLIAVPLPLPHRGSSHERVSAVLADTSPSVVLTTSAVAEDITGYVDQARLDAVPKIVEIDSMNLDVDGGTSVRTADLPSTAYLQYSSGSTRLPTGVMISHRNLQVNFEQLMRSFFADSHVKVPSNATIVSWLPFHHDMGLVLGVCAPILSGHRGELTSPISFLERPARWVRSLAENPQTWSGAPNFAFDLAARKTTDSDLAGLDLGGVLGIISGAERVEPATLRRFVDRFAHFNVRDHMVRPSYGLAEATVFVATGAWSESSEAVHFDLGELSAGRAQRCSAGTGTELVKYKVPQSPTLRIVDSDTNRECPQGLVGEIWVHGANVADGYWQKPQETERTFNAQLVAPSAGTPEGPWLRTGDVGFISEGELFIVGRIKDLLIIHGRNYYPEDIEATIQEITGKRAAAISVADGHTEKLVAIVELDKVGGSDEERTLKLRSVKREIISAISTSHSLRVADLVLVRLGTIPVTTSGKVRRSACVECYRHDEFRRLDVPADLLNEAW